MNESGAFDGAWKKRIAVDEKRWFSVEKTDRVGQIRSFVEESLQEAASAPQAVVVKANLNRDLMALTGNSVDFRVLGQLFSVLRDMGVKEMANSGFLNG